MNGREWTDVLQQFRLAGKDFFQREILRKLLIVYLLVPARHSATSAIC